MPDAGHAPLRTVSASEPRPPLVEPLNRAGRVLASKVTSGGIGF